MSQELTIALVPIFAAISSLFTFLLTTHLRQRKEWREGGEKAYEKAIEILKGRFERANDPAELAAIEQQLRGVEDDYLPYLQKKAADVSRDVVDKLAPAGAITPDMPALSPSDRKALERAAATIEDLDPPKTTGDHISQGNAFYAAGEIDKALLEFDAALELTPADPGALNNRGVTLDDLQRYDEAVLDYKGSLELQPDDPDTLNNRGVTLRHLQRYDEALADYNRALELRPDHLDTVNNRGVTLDSMKRYDEALSAYNRALELRPDDPDILQNRGVTLSNLQRYDEALADYNRALQLQPDHPGTLYNRACLFSQIGRFKESLKDLKEAISRDEKYRKMAREDEDFANLRSDPALSPEFERLVAGPEAASLPEPESR